MILHTICKFGPAVRERRSKAAGHHWLEATTAPTSICRHYCPQIFVATDSLSLYARSHISILAGLYNWSVCAGAAKVSFPSLPDRATVPCAQVQPKPRFHSCWAVQLVRVRRCTQSHVSIFAGLCNCSVCTGAAKVMFPFWPDCTTGPCAQPK